MRIIFVRHGEPDYDKDCLTDNGISQAKATAIRLKDENIKAVFASPMGRAMQTASFTASEHGLSVEELPFMHEINWGGEMLPYDGHPWTLAYDLICESSESLKGDNWREHPYFKDNICMDYYDRISAESDIFLQRFGLKREGDIYRCSDNKEDAIVIFAHGGSGAVFISHLLNLPFPYVLTAMPYGVCSVSIFDMAPLGTDLVIPKVEIFNDMGHLGEVRKEKLRFEK